LLLIDPEKNYQKPLFAYLIFSFIVIFCVSFLIFYLFEDGITEMKLEEIKTNEQRVVEFENDMFRKETSNIISDLQYLRCTYKDELITDSNYKEILKKWVIYSTYSGKYDQIRYIDYNGDEKVRVNYNENGAYGVKESDLQNKKDRYYFYETIKLEENMIYISPLDLNIEQGKIEEALKPMIRFSTPVYDNNGELKGIIILNYLAENMLQEFRDIALNSVGSIILLNSDGYWISDEDRSKEWNFMYDEKKKEKFINEYPDEWKSLIANKKQFVTSNGLITTSRINMNYNSKNYINKTSIVAEDEYFYIVSKVSHTNVSEVGYLTNQRNMALEILKKNKYYFILITLISGIIGLLIYFNRNAYMKIKYFAEYDSLTKLYNRRAGLIKLDNLQSSDDRRKLMISLCYIDINGLKEINDNLGHIFGDELITTVTKIIKLKIRENDFAMRLGGDEFLIVFSGVDKLVAENAWNRIILACEEINDLENRDYIISISHGIVFQSDKQNLMDSLIKEADEKMYAEKAVIKNITKSVLR